MFARYSSTIIMDYLACQKILIFPTNIQQRCVRQQNKSQISSFWTKRRKRNLKQHFSLPARLPVIFGLPKMLTLRSHDEKFWYIRSGFWLINIFLSNFLWACCLQNIITNTLKYLEQAYFFLSSRLAQDSLLNRFWEIFLMFATSVLKEKITWVMILLSAY